MNRASKDEAFTVSDSTDWLPTPLSKLADVENSLRCQVCKDFYATPMTTSCNHTFCSLCIRRSLNNDGKCPACRTPDQEMKLRFNAVLEDVVEAFKRAREQVLGFATRPIPTVVEEQGQRSPKRKRGEVKGREDEEDEVPRKKTRTSGRRTRSSQVEAQREEIVIADSDDEEVEVEVEKEEKKDEEFFPEDDLVECPICYKRVNPTTINTHLDRLCRDTPLPKNPKSNPPMTSFPSSISSKPPPPRPARLPQLNYPFLKDPALRKKLSDLHISTSGTRSLLEKRYTEWVTIWNANCDATHPKSKSELRRELEIWERTQGGRNGGGGSGKGGEGIRDKEFDGKGWANAHKLEFGDLIEKARAKVSSSRTEKPATSETKETGDGKCASVSEEVNGEEMEMAMEIENGDVVETREVLEQEASDVDMLATREMMTEEQVQPPPSSQGQGGTPLIGRS